jgi:TolB-like protein/DNA-binding winged helix-turn-helix (wHTH) protein/Flp pilus assembly protein TadD
VATEPGESVRFGEDFELDPRAWELRSGGAPVRLERIPMQILLFLVEQRGQLVTREAIVERVWGKSAFLDTDNSINGAIRKIRAALHDDPEHPQFIQTVTGCGYRFIAPLTQPAPMPPPLVVISEPERPVTAPPPPPPPQRSTAKWWAISALALVALGGEIAWFLHFSHPISSSAGNTAPRGVILAVLPLSNLTGDPGQEYFSDGLTEELIAQLGNSDPKHLGVIARTSVMRYKNTHESVQQIAHDLQAQYVLEGSVRRDDGSVRVTAQLVRASDQAHVWAQQYDRTMTSVLSVQGDIARRIAEEIRGTLSDPPSSAAGAASKVAQAGAVVARPAADLTQQAHYFLNKRTAGGLQKALVYFQQAIEKDGRSAPAYAGLSATYIMMSNYGLGPPRQYMTRARTAAVHALELDPNSTEAHSALGIIAKDYDYDARTAEREYRRALELNPNDATAHQWYADLLAAQSHFGDALAENERALTLEPQSVTMRADHGLILHFARQDGRALDAFRAVLAMDPGNIRAHTLIQSLAQQGDFQNALAQLADWRRVDSNPWQSATEAYVYGLAGDATRAGSALQEMERTNLEKGWDVLPMRALAYVGMGDKARLFETLETAYTERASFLTFLGVDPLYDPVRDDPHFMELVQRIGMR